MLTDSENNAFRLISIGEASQDKRLKGTLEFIINGETDLIPIDIADTEDADDLYADVAHKYNLNPEELQQAIELCEEEIFKSRNQDG